MLRRITFPVLSVATCLLFPPSLRCQTNIPSGTISTNTTWDVSGSPFVLACGGVTVPSGVTLTIAAGVVVEFQPFCAAFLRIDGVLTANGTATQSIFFTSQRDETANSTPGDWGALIFNNGATGSISNAIVRYGGGVAGSFNPQGQISI